MTQGVPLDLKQPDTELIQQLDIAVFNAAVNNVGEITKNNFLKKKDALERAEMLEQQLVEQYGETILSKVNYQSLALSWARETYDYFEDQGNLRLGDVNTDGEIDAADALIALQHSVHLVELSGDPFTIADVDGNDVVDAVDALAILQHSVRLIQSFPAEYRSWRNLDPNVTLQWEPSSAAAGSAAGTYTLTVADPSSSGAYDLCFADERGVLDAYAPIALLNPTADSAAVYRCLIESNLLPPEATRLAAVQEDKIKAYADIPQEKRLVLGKPLDTYALLSDVHVFETLDDNLNGFDELAMAFEAFYSMGIDLVSITGDLSMNFAATTDRAQRELSVIQAVFDRYENLDICACKGNHDKVTSEQDWQELLGREMDYSFTRNGDTFIYLSLCTTNNIGSNDSVAYGAEKLTWLEQKMKEAAGGRIYLFMHYPLPGYAGLKPSEHYGFTATSTEDDEILNLIRRYGNTYVFSGHTHYDFLAQESFSGITVTPIEGTNSYTVHVPSLAYPRSAAGSQLNTESQGFLVETYEDRILLKGIDFKKGGKIIPIGSYSLESKINPYYLSEAPGQMNAGETHQMEIMGKAYTSAVWSSSDTNVLKVDQQGKITAVAGGEAMITAVIDGYRLSVSITVAEIKPIVFPQDICLAVGEVAFAGPTGSYRSLSVTSSDSSIVSVDENGFASAHKEGTVTLTGVADEREYTVSVTAVDAPVQYPGEGTLENPYRISTATQFVAFQDEMKNGNAFENQYFIQTADLNLNYCPQYTAMADAGSTTFAGVYNGNGYTLKATVPATASSFAPPFFWYIAGTVVNTSFDVNIEGCASTSYGVCRKFEEGGAMVNCLLTGSIVCNNEHTTVVGGTSSGATIDNMVTYVTLRGATPVSSGVSTKGSGNQVDRYYYVENGCKSVYPEGEFCVSLDELAELSGILTENTGLIFINDVILCSWYTRGDLPAMNHDGGYTSETSCRKEITMEVGETVLIEPEGSYSSLSAVSLNEAVVSVDKNGNALAHKEGTATLLVTVDGNKYAILVTVVNTSVAYPGQGTPEDPYLISNANQFVDFQNQMKNGESFAGKYFLQTDDLNLNDCSDYDAMADAGSATFAGVYNGNGYVLKATVLATESQFAPPFFWYISGTVVNTGFDVMVEGCTSTSYGICRKFGNGGKMINCYLIGEMVCNNSFTTVVGGTSSGAAIDNMFTYVTLSGTAPDNGGISIKGGGNQVNRYYYVENGCPSAYPEGEICVDLTDLMNLSDTLTENASQMSVDNITLCSWCIDGGMPVLNHDGVN